MNILPIVFENNEILLINKPAGLAVQGGEKVTHSVDETLAIQTGQKIYPVHRLDKDTSGLLLVAKSSAAAAKWTQLIASGSVKKQYTAICLGIPGGLDPGKATGSTGAFTSDVGTGKDRRSARTEYKILSTARIFTDDIPSDCGTEYNTFSLLELVLGTGRTHQIRIHLAQNSCPIVADDKYGNFRLNKIIRKRLGIKTLHLAATQLKIPLDGKTQVFTVPLPEHMRLTAEKIFK